MTVASAAARSSALLRLVAVPVRLAAGVPSATAQTTNKPAAALLYAWRPADADNDATPTTPKNQLLPPVSAGATFSDRAVLLGAHVREYVERRLEREWRSVEAAPPNTLKRGLHRLANAVLKRSDPTEAALSRIPRSLDAHSPAVAAAIRRARGRDHDAANVNATATTTLPPTFEILHPASVNPRLVRRLLRRLCQRRVPEHRRGAVLWTAALLPQAPLSVLPLPNVTIYYTLWRIFMHASASVGAQSLLAALDRLSDAQRAAVLRSVARTTAETTTPAQRQQQPTPLPAPVFVACDDLPSPLAGAADAERLAAVLSQPHVLERYEALERRGGGGRRASS
jgi:hypothetical protein